MTATIDPSSMLAMTNMCISTISQARDSYFASMRFGLEQIIWESKLFYDVSQSACPQCQDHRHQLVWMFFCLRRNGALVHHLACFSFPFDQFLSFVSRWLSWPLVCLLEPVTLRTSPWRAILVSPLNIGRWRSERYCHARTKTRTILHEPCLLSVSLFFSLLLFGFPQCITVAFFSLCTLYCSLHAFQCLL